MRHTRKPLFLLLTIACPISLAGAVLFQPRTPSPTPQNPESYRELAELILSAEPGVRDNRLLIESALLGAALADQQGEGKLAASILIAAGEAASVEQRKQIWDTAVFLDPSIAGVWAAHRIAETPAAPLAESVLQHARYGAQLNADDLSNPEVRGVIASAAESAGYAAEEVLDLLRHIEQANDADPCRGRIFNPERNTETRQIERVLCPAHLRPHGALDSDDQFMILLHTELALARIPASNWTAEPLAQANRPVRDPLIGTLLDEYGLSLDRPYLSGGRWVASP